MTDTLSLYRRILLELEKDNMTMGSLIEVTGIPHIRFNSLIKQLIYLDYVTSSKQQKNRSKFDKFNYTYQRLTLTPKGIMLLDKINDLYSLIGE